MQKKNCKIDFLVEIWFDSWTLRVFCNLMHPVYEIQMDWVVSEFKDFFIVNYYYSKGENFLIKVNELILLMTLREKREKFFKEIGIVKSRKRRKYRTNLKIWFLAFKEPSRIITKLWFSTPPPLKQHKFLKFRGFRKNS